jgi:hypothetical protein
MNLEIFRLPINKILTLNVSLKMEDVEGTVKFFDDIIQWAGWNAMPEDRRRSRDT